ncbi:hypothetical protein ACT8ZS_36210 [Paenibacillus sp. M.A.Huq-84]
MYSLILPIPLKEPPQEKSAEAFYRADAIAFSIQAQTAAPSFYQLFQQP